MSKRILVVEDQPDNRQIIRDMLAPTDYEISEVEDGQQALEAIAKQQPDLILTPSTLRSPVSIHLMRYAAKPTGFARSIANMGFKPDGDSCVKITCPAGQVVGDDNTCEKQAPKRAEGSITREPERAPAAAPKKQQCFTVDRTVMTGSAAMREACQ
jgi:hypothetical protein